MITVEMVTQVAKLSKFKLSTEQTFLFKEQLNKILRVIDNLNSVNTNDVEPLYSPIHLENIFRDDSREKTNHEILVKEVLREELLRASKYYSQGRVTVPQVVK